MSGKQSDGVSGQLPTRTIPHHVDIPHVDSPHVDIGPDEWFYSLVVVLVGSCPSGEWS